MIVTMPINFRIVEVRPMKCIALAICIRMQMQPTHLHRQQTEAHNGND